MVAARSRGRDSWVVVGIRGTAGERMEGVCQKRLAIGASSTPAGGSGADAWRSESAARQARYAPQVGREPRRGKEASSGRRAAPRGLPGHIRDSFGGSMSGRRSCVQSLRQLGGWQSHGHSVYFMPHVTITEVLDSLAFGVARGPQCENSVSPPACERPVILCRNQVSRNPSDCRRSESLELHRRCPQFRLSRAPACDTGLNPSLLHTSIVGFQALPASCTIPNRTPV